MKSTLCFHLRTKVLSSGEAGRAACIISIADSFNKIVQMGSFLICFTGTVFLDAIRKIRALYPHPLPGLEDLAKPPLLL